MLARREGLKMKLFRNRNSYLTKIVLYFLIVLLIPLATIIVLNVQSQNTIRKQILLSNQNTLDLVFHSMDAVVTEMRDTCMDVAMRNELSQYVRSKQDDIKGIAYERYELYQLLSNYTLEKYEDLFIYFPQDGYIVSGVNGMLLAENYCRVFYNETEEGEQDFWNNLNTPYGYPVLNVINPWGENSKLCVTMRNMLDSELGHCIVTVVINVDYLSTLINEKNAGRGGTILVFNNQKELMLSGNKEKLPFDMVAYQGNDAPYETEFEGKKYIMQVYSFQKLKSYCAYAIPAEFFREQILGMRIFSIISMAICILLSGMLVWMASKKAYAPLGDIIQKLNGNNIARYQKRNIAEFEFLEEKFHSQEEEKRELYNQVRNSRNDLRERFLLRLFNGEIFDERHDDEIFKNNGITLCSDRFMVGVLEPENGCENDSKIISFAIMNVFEEVMAKIGKGYVISWQEGRHVFLLNLEIMVSKEQINGMLEEGKQFMEKYFRLHITIGCSMIHEGMIEIQKAFQESVAALAYQYVLGKERIIFWEEVSERTFSYLNSGQAMIPVIFEDYLNQTKESVAAADLVADIIQQYGINEDVSLETVECFKFDVINAVNRAALRSSMSADERKKSVRLLLEQETLAGFEECVVNLLMLFRQKKLEQKSVSICDQAKAFMEENYQNSQLSVATLCEFLGVSSSYLSRLYRERNNTSISREITRVRIKKAKELLHDTDFSIQEVAEKTGFSNGNVFIKVFKKWEGITPGRYRELL